MKKTLKAIVISLGLMVAAMILAGVMFLVFSFLSTVDARWVPFVVFVFGAVFLVVVVRMLID